MGGGIKEENQEGIDDEVDLARDLSIYDMEKSSKWRIESRANKVGGESVEMRYWSQIHLLQGKQCKDGDLFIAQALLFLPSSFEESRPSLP